jgi:glycosyltransferase involved in cell wall biosynthesis
VVHLVLSLDIGGLEAVVVNLAARASDGIEVTVVCLEARGALAERLVDRRINVECIGTPSTPVMASVRRLRRRLCELTPDVLHCHNQKALIHGSLATLGWRTPALIYTRHGRTRVSTLLTQAANRLGVHRSRFVVGVSDDASEIARREGARTSRLRVIRNGIDVQAYDAPGYHVRAGNAHAVTVARLAPVKDIGTLLRAARIVRRARGDFRLSIIGDGPSRPELEALSRELGLSETVTFHGASTDPRPFLADANIFVQSSTSEGLSLTLVEAMAAGLPVVATDVGGNAEVVKSQITGLLAPPRDPGALAEAILQILASPSAATAMSRSARARAEREFDVSRMVAEYEELYRQAARP